MAVKIMTDSTASIPKEWQNEHDITVIGLAVIENGVALPDDELDPETYYAHVATLNEIPTTSQPSMEDFRVEMDRIVREGHEVLCPLISEKMSGSIQCARLAAARVREAYPEARIEIVDTESNSLQDGMVALNAAKAAEKGASMDECLKIAHDTIARTRFIFVPKTLENLRKGGRIGNASALLGDLLKLRPVLTVERGETDSITKVRTDKKAQIALFEVFKRDVEKHGLRQAYVHFIGPKEPTLEFVHTYIEPYLGWTPQVIPVSATIGIHVGPTIASAVYECERPLR